MASFSLARMSRRFISSRLLTTTTRFPHFFLSHSSRSPATPVPFSIGRRGLPIGLARDRERGRGGEVKPYELSIIGYRDDDPDTKEVMGVYSTEVPLLKCSKLDQIKAVLKNGVLNIVVPLARQQMNKEDESESGGFINVNVQ